MIKNKTQLITSEARSIAIDLIEAGLKAISTKAALAKVLRVVGESTYVGSKEVKLNPKGKVYIVAIGKCALDAGKVLELVFKERIEDGIVLDVRKGKTKVLKAYKGTHPFPSGENVNATKKIIELLKSAQKEDIVFMVVSGGGSVLLTAPPKGVKVEDEMKLVKALFNAGADIKELNTIRKHLSYARGGYLAKYCYPGRVVSLIFSDVPGDDVQFIASGPTVKDITTIKDAVKIIKKYNVDEIIKGISAHLVETPKEEKYFKNNINTLAVSNKIALQAMREEAKKIGLKAQVITSSLKGEASEIGKEIIKTLHEKEKRTVLLYGGETTVTECRSGRGGRNQELVLSALRELKQDEIIASVASDGRDNGKYAGALGDSVTLEKIQKHELNVEKCLSEHNSSVCFEKTNDLIYTGSTGSNVSDLIIALKL